MPRCPDCNKFVSIEMADPEWIQEPEIAMDTEIPDTVTGELRLVQTCAECGEELTEAALEVEENFELSHNPDCEAKSDEPLELSYDASNNDRMEGKGRSAKHFYGADITITLTCPKCKAETKVETMVEEQSSSFESLV